jgi:hypothetical protein
MDYNEWQERKSAQTGIEYPHLSPQRYTPNSAQQHLINLMESEAVQKAKPFMAYGGAALILIGAMVPDINIGMAMDMKADQNNLIIGGVQTWNLSSTSIGMAVMGIAIAAMFFNYKREDNSLRWSGVAALVLSAYSYFNTISNMAMLGGLMTGFGMLNKVGMYTSAPWSLAWGTIFLMLGVAMVVAASFIDSTV